MVSLISLPIDMDALREELKDFWDDVEQEPLNPVYKGRVYVSPQDQVPEGVSVHRGKRGGIYYEAGEGQGEEDSPHVGTRFRDSENGLMTVVDVENGMAYVTDEYDEEFEIPINELEQRIANDPKARNIGKPKTEEAPEVEQKPKGLVQAGGDLTPDMFDSIEESEWKSTTPKGSTNTDLIQTGYVKPGTLDPHDGMSDTRVVIKRNGYGYHREMRTKAVYDVLGWDQCAESYKVEGGHAQRWVDDSGYGGESITGSMHEGEVPPEMMESFVRYVTVAMFMGNTDTNSGNFVIDQKRNKVWAIDNEMKNMDMLSKAGWDEALDEHGWLSARKQWQVEGKISRNPIVQEMREKAKKEFGGKLPDILRALRKTGMLEPDLIEAEERGTHMVMDL